KRDKDPMFANVDAPGVGVIDRLTVDSYVEVPERYIPSYARPVLGLARRLFPFISGSGYSIKIGPFPKGMPVGLLTNVDLLGQEMTPEEQEAHQKRLLALLKRAKSE